MPTTPSRRPSPEDGEVDENMAVAGPSRLAVTPTPHGLPPKPTPSPQKASLPRPVITPSAILGPVERMDNLMTPGKARRDPVTFSMPVNPPTTDLGLPAKPATSLKKQSAWSPEKTALLRLVPDSGKGFPMAGSSSSRGRDDRRSRSPPRSQEKSKKDHSDRSPGSGNIWRDIPGGEEKEHRESSGIEAKRKHGSAIYGWEEEEEDRRRNADLRHRDVRRDQRYGDGYDNNNDSYTSRRHDDRTRTSDHQERNRRPLAPYRRGDEGGRSRDSPPPGRLPPRYNGSESNYNSSVSREKDTYIPNGGYRSSHVQNGSSSYERNLSDSSFRYRTGSGNDSGKYNHGNGREERDGYRDAGQGSRGRDQGDLDYHGRQSGHNGSHGRYNQSASLPYEGQITRRSRSRSRGSRESSRSPGRRSQSQQSRTGEKRGRSPRGMTKTDGYEPAGESKRPPRLIRHTEGKKSLNPGGSRSAEPPHPIQPASPDVERPTTPPLPPGPTPPPPPGPPPSGSPHPSTPPLPPVPHVDPTPNPYTQKPTIKPQESLHFQNINGTGPYPSGPSYQPTSRNPSHAPTRTSTPIQRNTRFTMRSESQETEKLGRVFEGTTTLEDYSLGSKLGEGTFGVVTKATEKVGGAVVALKKLITHNPRDGVSVTTVREIKILKALEHENVVPIRAMVVNRKHPTDRSERGDVFMVFPYMDHDLCGLLANTNFKIGVQIAKTLMRQLLSGLAYIHGENIIHRDIKTANILVDKMGKVMIADFGLARAWTPKDIMPAHSENEYTNMVVTRWYRAPELLLGATKYGAEIDLWSTGCVFGEMFSTFPILCGESDRDQLHKIVSRCGPLDEESFPGWSDLPGFIDEKGYPWDQVLTEKSILDEATKNWSMSRCAVDLLRNLLCLDPVKRITALDALDHPWFWTAPLPEEPRLGMITVDSSHEFTTRRPEKVSAQPPMVARRNHNNHNTSRNGAQQNYGARPPAQGFDRRLAPPLAAPPVMQGMGQVLPLHIQQQQQSYQQYPNQPPFQVQPGQNNPYGQVPIRPPHQSSNGYQQSLPNPYVQSHHNGNPILDQNSGYPLGPPPDVPLIPTHNPGWSKPNSNVPTAPFHLAQTSAPSAPAHNRPLYGSSTGLPSRPVPPPGFPLTLAPSGPAAMAGGGLRMNAHGSGTHYSGGYTNGMNDGGRENGGLKRGAPGTVESVSKRPRPSGGSGM